LAFNNAAAGSASAAWVFNNNGAQRTRLNFGAGTINFGSISGNGSIANVAGSGASTMSVGALNTSTTYSGIIGDGTGQAQNISLVKVGTGTLTLSGVNKYTGDTVIDAGTLAISSALTGSTATGVLTVNDGGTLLVSVSSTNQLTPSSLTVGSSTGATLAFANVTNTTLAPLNPTNLVINGTATINVDSFANAALGTYPLVTNYTGGTVVLGTLPPYVSAHLDTANNQISLVVDSITPLFWAVGNGSWDTTSFNWQTNGVASHYADGGPVIFDDTATGTGTILVTNTPSAVSPASVTVNVTNKNYAIYGLAIAGNGALTKNGNGTLTLANTNTYSGGTTINGGTLQLSGSGTMGATNAGVTVSSGTVNLGGLSLTNGAVAISGGAITNGTLTGSSFSANNSSAVTIAANLSGSGALTKIGNGTLTLTGTNTYSGQTTVGAGTLAFSGGTNSIGNLMVTNNGQLSITAGTVNVNDTSGALTKIDGGATAVVSGGTLNINNSGGGWFPIGDTASTTGTFTVSGGTVNVVNSLGAQVARTGNGVLTITNNGSFIVNDANALGLSLSEGGGVSEVNLDGGTLTMIRLRPVGGTETFRFNGGTLVPTASRTDFFPSSGALTANVRNGGAIVDTAGFNVTIAQALVHSTVGGDNAIDGGLTKLGAGTLTLSGANTYTGNTTINAGTLQLNQSVPVLKTNSTVSIASGAVLNLNNGVVTNSVNTLRTNGVAVANGLYHAGVNLAPFLAGTGYIQVGSVGPSGPGYITNSITGNTLTLTWPAGQGWRLVSQTNSLSTGLNPNPSAWSTVPGYTDGNYSVTTDPAKPTVFYRLVNP
jgi:autotransporter-associated beta strand protein